MYEFKTTFWSDFSIADRFGKEAVQDTFDRAFKEWRSDVEYVTELAIVTNWKCWEHYNKARGYDLPRTQWGYQACLCGKKCDVACWEKLTGKTL